MNNRTGSSIEKKSPWIHRWEALFRRRSSTEWTSHLGNTRCINTLSGKVTRATLKELTKRNPTQHTPTIPLGSKHTWSYAGIYQRGKNAKIGMGKPQENLCGQYGYTETSTSIGAKQSAIEGYVDHKLHLEDQGTMWRHRFDQCHHRWWRDGANMPQWLSTSIWLD